MTQSGSPSPLEAPTLRCASAARPCRHVRPPEGANEAGPQCGFRKASLPAPEASFCADHSELAAGAERLPVGPIWTLTADGIEIEEESPDSNAVRNQLLNLAERVHLRQATDITFRERTVLWQLDRFRERRARPHLDRIRSELQRSGRPRAWLPFGGELVAVSLEAIARDEPDSATRAPLLDRSTSAGRALLVASLLVGTGAAMGIGWAIVGSDDPEAWGSRWWKLPLFAGFAAAGGVLVVGGRILTARGYELFAEEPQHPASTRSTERRAEAPRSTPRA